MGQDRRDRHGNVVFRSENNSGGADKYHVKL